jgi:hypothetical protein
MVTADKFIGSLKSSLVKSPFRRNELLENLKQYGTDHKLPPTPVITRWTTWLHTGYFHFRNLAALKVWIEATEDDSLAVQQLKTLVLDPTLEKELSVLATVFPTLSSAIKTLEGNTVLASEVWLHLNTVRCLLEENDVPCTKLTAYLTWKQPALSFWKDIRFLDHRQVIFEAGSKLPEALRKMSKVEIDPGELVAYRLLVQEENKNQEKKSPTEFWKNYTAQLPQLSKLATKLLFVPCSSADVERSFSTLKRIYTPLRSSLTDENLSINLRLAFNHDAMRSVPQDEDEDP